MSTALLTTCYREADTIDDFVDAVLSQTRQPEEFVVVDAGSDDGTVDRLRQRLAEGVPITLVVAPGLNRSAGRNRALAESTAELVAVTDVGAIPRPDWFERIIAPFETDPDVDVVAGYYEPPPGTVLEQAVAAATVPAVEEVNPDTFLPSGRSVALRRQAWEAVGGYPEWTLFAEDTVFGLTLRQQGFRFRFEPRAKVWWRPETRPLRLLKQFYWYARGDSRCRLWFRHYTKAFLLAAGTLGLTGAGFAAPVCWWGLPGIGLVYYVRHLLRARRRTSSPVAVALAPLVNVLVDAALATGYLRGLADRRIPADGNR